MFLKLEFGWRIFKLKGEFEVGFGERITMYKLLQIELVKNPFQYLKIELKLRVEDFKSIRITQKRPKHKSQ